MRTIFAKIFFWFWLAIAGVTLSVLLITVISGVQPLGRRWMAHTLDLYASSAVDFYTHGGAPQLSKYLNDIQESSGIRATLIDPQGNDVLGAGLPARSEWILAAARRDGESKFHTGWIWLAASVVHTPQGNFILVARIFPLRGFWNQANLEAVLLRWAIALLSAGLLCWLIARHITAPIAALQTATRRIADGDLSVRATPGIPPRNDELADLARDFDRMADRVQSLVGKQQELLADISHELRSPLARLSVCLELARRGDTDAMEKMQADLDRLDVLIGQVLTLTRLHLQEGTKIKTQVNLRSILESVAADAAFEGKSAEKSVVITQAEDCWVPGDAELLRSGIENIVRNALRYTRPQTAVEISLLRRNGPAPAAVVTVQDHGPGVPEDALPRLFEPFYRVEQSRDRGSGGSGLGLAIAQKVVSLHRGAIKASNRPQGGLAMQISLPLQPV